MDLPLAGHHNSRAAGRRRGVRMNAPTRLGLVTLVVVFVWGCATVSDTPPPGAVTAPVEFPPPMGTKWVVNETSKNLTDDTAQSGATTWTVMGEGTHNGIPVYHLWDGTNIHVFDRASRSWIAVLDSHSKEILANEPHEGKFSSPLWVGKSWTSRFTRHERFRGKSFYDVTFIWKVTAYEDVRVPAGTFKAYKIEAWPDSRAPIRKQVYWYAPEVKLIVKEFTEGFGNPYKIGFGSDRMSSTTELVQYTLGAAAGSAGGVPSASLVVPTTAEIQVINNLTLVFATLNHAQRSVFMVDTGASKTCITPAQAQRLGVSVPADAPRFRGTVVGGKPLDVPLVTLKAVQVGDAVVENLEVAVVDVAPNSPIVGGLLGGDFLQRFKVTIDRPKAQMKLEPVGDATGRAKPGDMTALRAALLTNPDPARRIAVAEFLGRPGSAETDAAMSALRQSLKNDPVVIVRLAAAVALLQLGAPPSELRPSLLPALQDDNADVRLVAAEVLGRMKPSVAEVPALLLALRDPDANVRFSAATALKVIDPPPPEARAALVATLKDSEAGVRMEAASALGAMKPSRSEISALIAVLRDLESDVRLAAVQALSATDVTEASVRFAFNEMLKDSEPRIRLVVIETLGKTGTLPAEEPAFVRALRDDDPRIRLAASTGLKEKAAAALPALSSDLADKDPRVRLRAAEALALIARVTPASVPDLIRTLGDEDTFVRSAAAEALGNIGAAAVPPLSRALTDPKTVVRSAAAQALGKIGPPAASAVQALVETTKDPDPTVRSTAVWALGALGTTAREAAPVVRALMDKDDSEEVRYAAKDALSRIESGPAAH